MREIKFRGKRVDTEEWVYGSLFIYGDEYFIITDGINYFSADNQFSPAYNEGEAIIIGDIFKVIPETVGQFTGWKDKSGREIYERHLIKDKDGYVGEVRFIGGTFVVDYSRSGMYYYSDLSDACPRNDCIIVGNSSEGRGGE